MIRQPSPAKRLLTEHGIGLSDLAAVTGLAPQTLSKHLGGATVDPSHVVRAVRRLAGDALADEVAARIAAERAGKTT